MRTIITITALLVVATQLNAQEEIQPQVEKRISKIETRKSVNVTKDLFLAKEVPSDFPNMAGKDVAVQEQIIQGYINVYSHLIDKTEALKMGYSFPENAKSEDVEKQRALREEKHRRTTPLDPQDSRENQ